MSMQQGARRYKKRRGAMGDGPAHRRRWRCGAFWASEELVVWCLRGAPGVDVPGVSPQQRRLAYNTGGGRAFLGVHGACRGRRVEPAVPWRPDSLSMCRVNWSCADSVRVVEPRPRLVARDTRDMSGTGTGHIAMECASARH